MDALRATAAAEPPASPLPSRFEPVTRLHFLSAPVLAALAVDAACGVLAAAVANGLGVRLNMETFFIGCALAAALGHAVLVPGYVWAAGPLAPKTLMRALLMRTVVAGIALPCAVVAAAVIMVVLRLAAGRATSLDPTDTLALTASGIVVGLGAIGAQWVDGQPGRPRLPGWTHVTGAVAGLWLVLGATNLSGQVQGMPWARALLALATVVAAGLPHTLLAAWAAVREGHVFPAPAATKRRAAWCGATLGVAALGVAANAFLAEGL